MAKKLTDQKWTEDELAILYQHGTTLTAREVAKLLPKHTKTSVASKITRLKIKGENLWTEQELTILRNHAGSIKTLQEQLPGRSYKAILKTRMRYQCEKYKDPHPWTTEELDILRQKGMDFLSSELTDLLPRHTASSIGGKCNRLEIYKTSECRARLSRLAQSQQPPPFKLDQNFTLDDLDNTTWQILVGSVFGDGCCSMDGPNYIFTEGHGWEQRDYVLWKQPRLKVFQARYYESQTPVISTPSHPVFRTMRESVYGTFQNKTFLPPDLVGKLDLLGLLIWYLDDGHLGRPRSGLKPNGKICQTYPTIGAKGYQLGDILIAIDTLNSNLGLNSYLLTRKHNGKDNKLICFNNDKQYIFPIWKRMFDELGLPECMRYKLQD